MIRYFITLFKEGFSLSFSLSEFYRTFSHHCIRTFFPLSGVMVMLGGAVVLEAKNLSQIARPDLLLGGMFGLTILRELAPVVTGVVLSAQGGSFVTTELGVMRMKEEFSALELLGVSPVGYAIFPRFLALFFLGPILTLYAIAGGLGGGTFLLLTFYDITPDTFFSSLFRLLNLSDLLVAIGKGTTFSFLLSFLATYYGYTTEGGPVEIGRSAHKTVVYSLASILTANYFLSSLFFSRFSLSV
jgi:phospholipid/cholesterol/gamma-HCH transport system permease protein